MDDASIHDIIGAIYDTALQPDDWNPVFEKLRTAMGLDTWALMLHGPEVAMLALGGDGHSETAGDMYEAHFGAIDPTARHVMGLRQGAVAATNNVFDERFIDRSEYYQDFLLPQGLRYLMGGKVLEDAHGAHVLGVVRSPERGIFTRDDIRAMEALMPHLRRALLIGRRIEAGRAQAATLASANETASTAVIGLNARMHIVATNAQAEALLRAGRLFRLRGRVLQCLDPSRQGEFADGLRACFDTGLPSFMLLGAAGDATERYTVNIVRNRQGTPSPLSQEGAALICLVAPVDRRRLPTARQLMALFGFTAAEARLARALAGGGTLESHAEESGLKITTVKTQLRGALAKTGCDRQAALIRVIAAVPAVRDPDGRGG